MTTQTDNPHNIIHKLQRELGWKKKMIETYQREMFTIKDLKEEIEILKAENKYLKTLLRMSVKTTSTQEHIEAAIGEVYPHFLPSMIASRSRKGELVELRQIWMQLMYKYSGLSLSKVGDIAGRDHTTVIHAINKVDAMCLYEKRFRLQYEKVLKNLIDKLHSTEN
jgi:chromosomal replication initiator protein